MINSYQEIINILDNAKTIALYMHINPDGDCIGSSLSLLRFLEKKEKTVHAFSSSSSSVPLKLQFLPFSDRMNKYPPLKTYDISVGLDLGDSGRLGEELYKQFMRAEKRIVIDHHEDYNNFAEITLREEKSASTTQILYKIFKQWDKKNIDSDIATLLYTGIVTDTGGFSFSNTTSETHKIASELLQYGIDNADISRRTIKDIDLNVFLLRNKVYTKAEFYNDGKIGIINFRQEDFDSTGCTEDDTEGAINGILNVNTIEIAISIAEIGDKKYKISFRTKYNVSAGACAKTFGGGGHFHAAGCRAYGYYEDVHDKVLSVAREMLAYAD